MPYLLGTLPGAAPALTGEYLLVILVLLLVLVLAYLFTRYLANRGYTYARGKYMQVKESIMVGRDKSILLLEAGNQYYIVGISGQQIQLLATLSADELREMQQPSPSPAAEGLRGIVARATAAARKFTGAQKELRNARAASKKTQQQEAALQEALRQAAAAQAAADEEPFIAPIPPQAETPPTEAPAGMGTAKKGRSGGKAPEASRKLEIVKPAPAVNGAPAAQSAPVREQMPATKPPVRQTAKAAKPSFEEVLERANERLLTGEEEPAVIVDLSGETPPAKKKPAKAAKRKEDEIDKMMQSIEERTRQLRQRRRSETPPHEGD